MNANGKRRRSEPITLGESDDAASAWRAAAPVFECRGVAVRTLGQFLDAFSLPLGRLFASRSLKPPDPAEAERDARLGGLDGPGIGAAIVSDDSPTVLEADIRRPSSDSRLDPVADDGQRGRNQDRTRHARRARTKAMCFGVILALAAGGFVACTACEGQLVGRVAQPMLAGTPGVAAAREGSPTKEEPPPSEFDAGELRDRIGGISASHPGRYGVVVYDPGSGETVSLGGEERFYAASVGKLPALMTLYRDAAAGEERLESRISILPADVSGGSGVLNAFPAYSEITLRESAYYLTSLSDNTAWAMLDRHLGEDRIQDEMDSLGAGGTDYSERLTTPEDVMLMLRAIADPRYTSEAHSEEMLDHMTETAYEDRIPAPLPPNVRVAHKIGSYGDSFGDAGVVFYKDRSGRAGRYYLVVLADGTTTEQEARDAMREISSSTYEALVGQ